MTINSLPLAKAEPYGQKVSREAKTDDGKKGFGDQIQDQINPKDNKGIGQEYRQVALMLGEETVLLEKVANSTEIIRILTISV